MANDKMTLTVVLPLDLSARIDAAAREAKRTRAQYVRLFLEEHFPPPARADETKKGHK